MLKFLSIVMLISALLLVLLKINYVVLVLIFFFTDLPFWKLILFLIGNHYAIKLIGYFLVKNLDFIEKKFPHIKKILTNTDKMKIERALVFFDFKTFEEVNEIELKKRYKKVSRKFHPDLAEESLKEEYTEKMQEINEFYSVLKKKIRVI